MVLNLSWSGIPMNKPDRSALWQAHIMHMYISDRVIMASTKARLYKGCDAFLAVAITTFDGQETKQTICRSVIWVIWDPWASPWECAGSWRLWLHLAQNASNLLAMFSNTQSNRCLIVYICLSMVYMASRVPSMYAKKKDTTADSSKIRTNLSSAQRLSAALYREWREWHGDRWMAGTCCEDPRNKSSNWATISFHRGFFSSQCSDSNEETNCAVSIIAISSCTCDSGTSDTSALLFSQFV